MTARSTPIDRVPSRSGWVAALPAMTVDGTRVHLVRTEEALALVAAAGGSPDGPPLAVASINLDHIHHFGLTRRGVQPAGGGNDDQLEWLALIDGAPLAKQARRLTGVAYPRLSGSDLIVPILDEAALRSRSVGIVGGSPQVTDPLVRRFARDWPTIRFAGHWTPSRDELADADAASRLADEIRAAEVDILLVCLGKPRQEEWIATHGARTGAGVLLAFGAVVDFLAGRVSRAPGWIAEAGLEWAWRLMLEPRRLARRYLVQGPPAYLALRRASRLGQPTETVSGRGST